MQYFLHIRIELWLQNSRVIIITAGARQKEGETRLDLVQKNVEIFKGIIPELVKYSPDAVIVVVTNPCDIMAWVTWKLSGLPKHRVIASGTMLDTSRFRHLLAERFNVGAHSVHGYILFNNLFYNENCFNYFDRPGSTKVNTLWCKSSIILSLLNHLAALNG